MYIQLKEKSGNFKSPVLYIHNDEDEAEKIINIWLENLRDWANQEKFKRGGPPLSRLDANTAIVDLCYTLGQYYIDTTPKPEAISIHDKLEHVESWLRLFNYEDVKNENILIIEL